MQKTQEERFLPPSIPPSMQLYHKIGLYSGYVHDGGILDDGKNPLAISIFTYNTKTPSYDARAVVFQEIMTALVKSLENS